MNDELRELLSAYLDGALSEPARRELESRLAGSEDLRRELAELRAVAEAVRALPKHDAPPGFVARLQARRARGGAERRDWVLLPPSLRPVALALSCGVVALWIWQDVAVRTAPPGFPAPAAPAARLSAPGDAPLAQLNVSGLAAGGAADASLQESKNALGFAEPEARRPSLVRARAKGRALDEVDAAPAATASQALPPGAAAPSGAVAMSEQERSARNVQMFADLERQKRDMGIASIAPSGGSDSGVAALRGAGLIAPEAAPAPVVAQRVPRMAMKAAKKKVAPEAATASAAPATPAGRPSPDAGLVLTDAGSLASSWVLLGFPKTPPSVDFTNARVLLIKPSVSRIVSVTTTGDAVVVVYRTLRPDEASDPARDRFTLLPLQPDAVQIFDATPR